MKTIYVSPHGQTFPAAQTCLSLAEALPLVQPGDVILLDGSCTYPGGIVLEGLKGISLGSFGAGRAVIDAGLGMGIILRGCEDISLFGLVLRGAGWKENEGGGILADACRNVRIRNIAATGFGDYGFCYQDTENLVIEGCYAYRNGETGIVAGPGKSRNIRIAYCKTHDNGGSHRVTANHSGSGIIIAHTEDAVVEYCEAAGNGWAQRQTKGNGPVGIWCWGNAVNVVFRYCIAHHNRTQPGCGDGDGFDIDGGARHIHMEHCYSYENEASGFLLCEYGSGMGWCDDNVRDCVSMLDVTRVGGYGTVHLYCPPDSLMEGSDIERNLFVAPRGIHPVENRFVSEGYTDINIRDNHIFTDDPIFACPPQPQIDFRDNFVCRYTSLGTYPERALQLTDPRSLDGWEPFTWLDKKCADPTVWIQRLARISQAPEGPCPGPGESFLFSILLGGPDLEGSFQKGDCRLAYDSLKPGVVTALRGEGAEVSTYLPLSGQKGKCILRAYGRAMEEDAAACLFVRETNGKETRIYWNGTVSGYGCVELPYTPEADGLIFGVRMEKGADAFLVDRIDVYTAGDAPAQGLAFSLTGNAYRDAAGSIILEGGGSAAQAYLQNQKAVTVRFEARGTGGSAFFCGADSDTVLPVAADTWQAYALELPAADRLVLGFCADPAEDARIEIRNITLD